MKPAVKRAIALDTHAKFFRGLADRARLGLLLCLRDGPRPAGELASACALSPSNASNHLRCLLECGLVKVEARGRHNVYRLAVPEIGTVLEVSARILATRTGTLIESCHRYGPPSRRDLRATDPRKVASRPRPSLRRASNRGPV